MLQKLPQKEWFKKTAEATGDLNGNKIDDQTTSAGKSKEDDKTKKVEQFVFHQKKDNKFLMI